MINTIEELEELRDEYHYKRLQLAIKYREKASCLIGSNVVLKDSRIGTIKEVLLNEILVEIDGVSSKISYQSVESISVPKEPKEWKHSNFFKITEKITSQRKQLVKQAVESVYDQYRKYLSDLRLTYTEITKLFEVLEENVDKPGTDWLEEWDVEVSDPIKQLVRSLELMVQAKMELLDLYQTARAKWMNSLTEVEGLQIQESLKVGTVIQTIYHDKAVILESFGQNLKIKVQFEDRTETIRIEDIIDFI